MIDNLELTPEVIEKAKEALKVMKYIYGGAGQCIKQETEEQEIYVFSNCTFVDIENGKEKNSGNRDFVSIVVQKPKKEEIKA